MSETISAGVTSSGITVAQGATLTVFGTVSFTTVSNGGNEIVSSGGTASSTTVSNGGNEVVSGGGQDISATVNSGGFLVVSNGGSATFAVISAGGDALVASGGTLVSASVFGVLAQDTIASGGTASSTTIGSGGLDAVRGGTASFTTVSSGGTQLVSGGGLAISTTVDTGGSLIVSNGGSATFAVISAGGDAVVVSGGTLVSATLSGALAQDTIASGGVASATEVNSGGQDTVRGGTASFTTVSNGGTEVVSGGGLAISTTVDTGGFLIVSNGGSATFAVISARGDVVVSSGGTLVSATVRGAEAEDTILSGGTARFSVLSIGGTEAVSSGGSSVSAVVNGGTLSIESGGTVTGATVTDGGTVIFNAGGVSTEVQISENGSALVSIGAVVSGIVVSGAGVVTVSSGGTAVGTNLSGSPPVAPFEGVTVPTSWGPLGSRRTNSDLPRRLTRNYLGTAMAQSADATNVVSGTAPGQTLTGESGVNNFLISDGGGSTLVGGGGDDTFLVVDPADQAVVAPNTGGIDTIVSFTSYYQLPANVQNLFLQSASGAMGVGNDLPNLLVAEGPSTYTLVAGTAADVLIGNGSGSSLDTGGSTTFVITKGDGNDVIANFVNGVDIVRLVNFTNLTSFAAVTAAMTQVGTNVVLNLGGGETLTFRDETIGSFSASDFGLPAYLTNMSLMFQSNFNNFVTSPDGSVGWDTTMGAGARTLATNNEAEYYSDSSVGVNPFSVSNGVLSITAAPGTNPLGLPYDSGAVTTEGSFSAEYGFWQVTAELPAGAGLWPAIWLLPENLTWPPEIDILEGLQQNTNEAHTGTNTEAFGGVQQNGQWNYVGNTTNGFHNYGLDFEPNTITWYFDGNAIFSEATPAGYNQPMYLLINLAVGGAGSWPGMPTSAAEFPATMQVSNVQFYASVNTTNVSGTAVQAPAAPVTIIGDTPTSAVTLVTSALGSGGNQAGSGAAFSGITVNSGGNQVISAGGTASGTVVRGGGSNVVRSGGTDSGTAVSSGGYEVVSNGGDAVGVTASSGGTLAVSAGGTAISATLSGGGRALVYTGGTASGTTVQGDSFEAVYAGGTASQSVVGSGGAEFVFFGGIASGDTIESGGYLVVLPGGSQTATTGAVISSGDLLYRPDSGFAQLGPLASGGVIASGAIEYVLTNGTAVGATVSSGGIAFVYSGGTAGGMAVNSGGFLIISNGGSASGGSVNSGGYEVVSNGGTVSGTAVDRGGYAVVSSGGTVIGGSVNSGGYEIVSSGGMAVGVSVNSGGYQVVSAGGTASGTTVNSGGYEVISNGGSGGFIAVSRGGSIDFPNLVFSSGGVATVSSASDVLTVTEGGANAQLQLAGVYAGGSFQPTQDANGGTTLTFEAAQRTLTWTGMSGSAFSTASNWNDVTDGLDPALSAPGQTDTAQFLAGGGAITGTGSIAALTFDGGGVWQLASDAQLTVSGAIVIGVNDATDLTIAQGSRLIATGTAPTVITNAGNSSGSSVNVSGAGSTWQIAAALDVGAAGSGILNLSGGATVVAGSLDAANIASDVGQISLSGAGTELTVNGPATIADDGTGVLSVLNGATFSAASLTIGSQANSSGAVVVSGTGSVIHVTGALNIGTALGTGDLTIGPGAAVHAGVISLQGQVVQEGGLLDPSVFLDQGSDGGTGTTGSDFTIDEGTLFADSKKANGVEVVTGTVLGGGTLTITGGTPLDGTTVNTPGLLQLNNIGTLEVTGPVLNAAVTTVIDDGSLVGAVTVFGTYEVQNSVIDVQFLKTNEVLILDDIAGFAGTVASVFGNDQLVITGGTLANLAVSNGNTLTMSDSGQVGGTDQIMFAAPVSAAEFTIVNGNTLEVIPCFARGTRIGTPEGPVTVEDLRPGDQVLTVGGGARPVRWIGHRAIDLDRHPDRALAEPIRIRKDAIAKGRPCRDLLVSPDHALFLNGSLVPARLLVNGASITREASARHVVYYHVELDTHDILYAEDLATESYLDTGNRAMFENGGQPLRLHADFAGDQHQREARSCAPFASRPEQVEPMWLGLAKRADALGWRRPKPAAAMDAPDLHLLGGSRRIEPLSASDRRYVFAIPPGEVPLRLVSRTARPCDARPWVDDGRQLGVLVRRMIFHFAHGVREVAMDAPAFGRGWHEVEWHAQTPCRWTDGDAVLSTPGSGVLEVELGGTMRYPIEDANVADPIMVRRIA